MFVFAGEYLGLYVKVHVGVYLLCVCVCVCVCVYNGLFLPVCVFAIAC